MARVSGEVRQAMVFVEDPALAVPEAMTAEAENIFAEMQSYMVHPRHVDDARAAVYTRLEDE